ncbi:MAG: radical SAM protein, partial [Spirochaetota bacterium]|nr:radical SAM protein [Spirochaetota bacterium]
FSCYKENGIIIESKTLFNPLSIPNYTHILTPKTSFSNSFLIELTRGCKFKCNFCTVPSIFGKLRHFSKENIIMALDLGLAKTKKVGFISALTTEHPDLKELIYYVNANGGEISFSSMRIEQIDNELLNLIRKNKQNILTIAPEVASEKLKKKLHKSIKNEKILDLFERALQTKFKKFKFYFIIGFAEEDHDDLNGIINLMKRIKQIALTYARVNKYMPELILSINQFIPKPKTPLHVETFVNYKLVKDRFNYLKKNILSLGNITINHDNYKENYIQWRFSHGNENLSADVIEWIKKNNNVKSIYQFLSKELI